MIFSINILSSFQSGWLVYSALAIVLLIQMGLLMRSGSLPKKRFLIRAGLNLFLWLLVFLFVFQPEWKLTTDTSKVLLVDASVPEAYIRKVKDSLQIRESLSNSDFTRLAGKNPHWVGQLGSIYLLGQNYNPRTISRLSNKKLIWIPYYDNKQLQDLSWKSLVRKGEIQEVSGKITVGEPLTIALKYGNQVLDSLNLQKGFNAFRLSFPVFTIGRTQALLTLNNQPLQEVHFFSRAASAFNVLFILQNPDFESKTLSEWLGKNNHRVELLTTIAKDAQSRVSINQALQKKLLSPDIIITDPDNASHGLVKKAISEGKSVLFINCTNPEQDARTINQALATSWRLKRTSNEQFINIGDNLTALPYELTENINQKSIGQYPVAIQKKTGKIGLSLLNETFPLKLSGDSLIYAKIWSGILQQLIPPSADNVLIQSPVFPDTQTPVVINNASTTTGILKIAGDTTQLAQSTINPLTSTANYIFRKPGWQSFQDSLNVYVEEKTSILQKTRQLEETLQAHQNIERASNAGTAQTLSVTLPDWLWYTLIIIGLTALWLEPKLNF